MKENNLFRAGKRGYAEAHDFIDANCMFRKHIPKPNEGDLILEFPSHKLKVISSNGGYRVQFPDGSYQIKISAMPLHFGGERYFYHCPRCDKTFVKLYRTGVYYACRKCLRLCYVSQNLARQSLYIASQAKVRDQLKSLGGSIEERPFNMRHKTFKKLKKRYYAYEDKLETYIEKKYPIPKWPF